MFMRKEIPSDNSCMFNSFYYCLSNGQPLEDASPSYLRSAVVDFIKNWLRDDKCAERFCKATLGRELDEYFKFIMAPESWGGAIELSILAEIFCVQVKVADIQSGNIYALGGEDGLGRDEGAHAPRTCMYLLYDGVHYDAAYKKIDGQGVITIFDVE
ncbi:hypothetical protein ACOME3_001552 [Neoechinorhynchus agilis]